MQWRSETGCAVATIGKPSVAAPAVAAVAPAMKRRRLPGAMLLSVMIRSPKGFPLAIPNARSATAACHG